MTADQLARIEVPDQLLVEQVGVALDEPLEALGPPALAVHGHEVEPGAGDRLVILVFAPVQPSDVPDRRDHNPGRFVDRVKAQVVPRQLKVLAMAEAAASIEDLVEDLKVSVAYGPTVATAGGKYNKARSRAG